MQTVDVEVTITKALTERPEAEKGWNAGYQMDHGGHGEQKDNSQYSMT